MEIQQLQMLKELNNLGLMVSFLYTSFFFFSRYVSLPGLVTFWITVSSLVSWLGSFTARSS